MVETYTEFLRIKILPHFNELKEKNTFTSILIVFFPPYEWIVRQINEKKNEKAIFLVWKKTASNLFYPNSWIYATFNEMKILGCF